jgi:hypothetical protein
VLADGHDRGVSQLEIPGNAESGEIASAAAFPNMVRERPGELHILVMLFGDDYRRRDGNETKANRLAPQASATAPTSFCNVSLASPKSMVVLGS